jgi:hypothetical protein
MVKFWRYIRRVSDSNLGRNNDSPDCGFAWYLSVSPGICWDSTLHQAKTSSKPSFIVHSTRHEVCSVLLNTKIINKKLNNKIKLIKLEIDTTNSLLRTPGHWLVFWRGWFCPYIFRVDFYLLIFVWKCRLENWRLQIWQKDLSTNQLR